MKTRYIIAIAAAALTLSGCQKEGSFSDGEFGGDAVVRFVPSVSGSSSATHTKGTLYNETLSPVSLGEYVSEFMVTAYNMPSEGDPVKFIPDATASAFGAGFTADGYQKVMKRDGEDETEYWMTVQPSDATVADDEYIWKKNEVKTFYAYANLPAGEAATVASADATGQTLEYTVPATASAQTDILLGYYYGQGKTGSPAEQTGTAGIVFQHPLTAVRFIYGTITGNPDIRSIRLDGVAQRGTATMSPVEDHPESATIEWSGVDAYTHTVSQTKESGLPVASSVPKLIGEPFLLIPQDVAANHVTVTVTFTNSTSVSATIPAASLSGKWDAGKVNTYTINYVKDPASYNLTVTPWYSGVDEPMALEKDKFIYGKFSVSPTEYVQFSRGNLQATYHAATSSYTWNFAINQYDYIGEAPGNNTINNNGTNNDGAVVDLFGWSTSKTNYGIYTTRTEADYSGDFKDWGTAIDPTGKTWRTLSGGADGEWNYLLNVRTVKGGTGDGYCYTNTTSAGVTIEGIIYKGLFIYPDDYSGATIGSTGAPDTWIAINAAGIVFLPAAGGRGEASPYYFGVGTRGCYWSSTSSENGPSRYRSYHIDYSSSVDAQKENQRYYGFSVRLVQKFIKTVKIGDVCWANVNIGASEPKDYGYFFSWGNTTGYVRSGSDWVTAEGGVKLVDGFSEDNYKSTNGYSLSGDIPVNAQYDAARAYWGEPWRMPTLKELQDLYASTYWEWDDTDKGIYVYSPKSDDDKENYNGKSGYNKSEALLFFPASGASGGPLPNPDTFGYLWTSSIVPELDGYANMLGFLNTTLVLPNLYFRYVAVPIRPVRDATAED